ncbi:MAG: zinc transport system substrate-binding protein [Pseudohongiellaceae bacterium]
MFYEVLLKVFYKASSKMFSKKLVKVIKLVKIAKQANSALAHLIRLGSFFLLIGACVSATADIAISTTIRPLYFIALAVVGPKGNVNALIDSKSSPHHFNLTPSNRLALLKSDLIVWIGPELESQLSNSISKIAADDRIIMATELPDLISHKIGDGDQIDAHIWLDTRNASLIAAEIAQIAKRLDPANSDYYQNNLAKFQMDLGHATDQIGQLFTRSNAKPFAVYHNGFQYFEKQFGLSHQLELVRDPEIAPTISQIIDIRKKVAQVMPECLFQEPDANPELVRTMLRDYRLNSTRPNNDSQSSQSPPSSIREITIDLLGNDIVDSPAAYINLITHVSDEFSKCLNITAAND